jgi:hypothetical protein
MAFPTDALIVALFAGTSSGLGVAWLNNLYENRRATRASTDARAGRQRDAYADLIVAARLALRNARQMRILYERTGGEIPDDPTIRSVLASADSVATDLNKATAIVALVGSDDARAHAKTVLDAAASAAGLYQERSRRLANAKGRDLAKARGEIFDAAEAAVRCQSLDDAIEAFVGAVRPELT